MAELGSTKIYGDITVNNDATIHGSASISGSMSVSSIENGNNNLLIKSNTGKLLVGTISSFPWADSKLEIRGGFRLYDVSSSSYGIRFGSNTTQPFIDAYRETVGAVDLQLNPSGGDIITGSDVIIPNNKGFQIKNNSGTPTNVLTMNASNDVSTVAGAGGDIRFYHDGGNDGSALSIIDNTGKAHIGIDTDTPTAKLTINCYSNNGLRVQREDNESQYIALHEGVGNAHYFDGVGAKSMTFRNYSTDLSETQRGFYFMNSSTTTMYIDTNSGDVDVLSDVKSKSFTGKDSTNTAKFEMVYNETSESIDFNFL